jgi:hypothetical protein
MFFYIKRISPAGNFGVFEIEFFWLKKKKKFMKKKITS